MKEPKQAHRKPKKPKRKLADVVTYRPTRMVPITPDEMRRLGIVDKHGNPFKTGYIMQDRPAIADLTNEQRDIIVTRTGRHFAKDDWSRIDQARRHYAWLRGNELSGIEFSALEAAANKIMGAAEKLKHLLDYLSGAADHEMWRRIAHIKTPSFGWDEIYPVLSQLVARVHLVREALLQEKEHGGWLAQINPWTVFIDDLANIYAARGWKVSASRPPDRAAPRMSPFVEFVAAVIETLPADVRNKHIGDSALIEAVAKSLAERRRLAE